MLELSFVRPYPIATGGVPVSIDFDIKTSIFKLVVEPDNALGNEATEIYLPDVHYGKTNSGRTTSVELGMKVDAELEGTYRSRLVSWHESQADIEVDVQVSSGRYEIQGNILKWYHEPAEKDMDPQDRHSITIKRFGGPRHNLAGRSPSPSLWRNTFDSICSCVVA